jgi:hypothetical protein
MLLSALKKEEDFDIIVALKGLVAQASVLYGWRNGIWDVMRNNIN